MRIVVTGAGRGLGLELVRQLEARGDDVIAAVRHPDRAAVLRAMKRVQVRALDVTQEAEIERFARTEGSEPLDMLINNAGIAGGDSEDVRGAGFGIGDASLARLVET